MPQVDITEFYKNYSEEEVIKIKQFLSDNLSDLNEDNIEQALANLSRPEYNKYPEIAFYRINLLIRLGKLEKALTIATAYQHFKPISLLANELKDKLASLQDEKDMMKKQIFASFTSLFPSCDKKIVKEEIDKYLYEDLVIVNDCFKKIKETSNIDELLSIVSNQTNNRYLLVQYYRISLLKVTGSNVKAEKILKPLSNRPLFNTIYKPKNINSQDINRSNIIPQKEVSSPIVEVDNTNVIEEDREVNPLSYETLEAILLTKIYIGNITLEEINTSSLDEYAKIVLTTTYYNRFNCKMGISYLKQVKKQYIDDPNMVKKINILYQYLSDSHNANIVDYIFYASLLNCSILYSKIEELQKEEVKEEIIVEDKEEISKPKDSIDPKESISKKEPKKEPKYIVSSPMISTNKSKTKKVKKDNETKEVTISDLLYDDVLAVKKYLYCEMNKTNNQANAIKAWDIFDELTSKSINDKQALTKVINILEKFQNVDELELPVEAKVYRKYI